MIINGGVYEVNGELLMVIGLAEGYTKVEVCEVTKFDADFYGEGDPKFEVALFDDRLEDPENFKLENLKGHKTFLLGYLLENEEFASKHDLSKFIKK